MWENKKRFIAPLLVAVGVLATGTLLGLAAAYWPAKPAVQRTESGMATPSAQADTEGFDNQIVYEGKTYTIRTGLTTVLFLGVDKEIDEGYNDIGLGSGPRSDVLILLILNDNTQTMQALQISRDTMINVGIYDKNENYEGDVQRQITLQYTYGTNAKRSCWLTQNKVSQLLYGAPVDATAALSMEGVQPIVDALGGIKLTIPANYTEIDPVFTQGATLTLSGVQAYRYIHYRNCSVTGSNDDRMARQVQLLRALAAQLPKESSQLEALQSFASPYLESDVDAETLQKLSQYTLDDNFLNVPGETQAGEFHDEYIVDEDALRRMAVELFYEAA